MKQCPFCHTEVPNGASDCTGCGAYEQLNADARSILTKALYGIAFPLLIWQLPSLLSPKSTSAQVVAIVLILVYLWRVYLPWSNQKMWYRKH